MEGSPVWICADFKQKSIALVASGVLRRCRVRVATPERRAAAPPSDTPRTFIPRGARPSPRGRTLNYPGLPNCDLTCPDVLTAIQSTCKVPCTAHSPSAAPGADYPPRWPGGEVHSHPLTSPSHMLISCWRHAPAIIRASLPARSKVAACQMRLIVLTGSFRHGTSQEKLLTIIFVLPCVHHFDRQRTIIE